MPPSFAPPVDPFAGAPLTNVTRRARRVARSVHRDEPAPFGGTVLEHVERVVLRVPPSARAVAFVHDAPGRPSVTHRGLAALLELDEDERGALVLLAGGDDGASVRRARRIASAPRGPARELALTVLRAELEDHAWHDPVGPAAHLAALAVVDDARAARGPSA